MNDKNNLNNLFGGKDPLEGFPSIFKGQKSKPTSSYVEDPNDDLSKVFGRKPLEGFPSIYKKKDKK